MHDLHSMFRECTGRQHSSPGSTQPQASATPALCAGQGLLQLGQRQDSSAPLLPPLPQSALLLGLGAQAGRPGPIPRRDPSTPLPLGWSLGRCIILVGPMNRHHRCWEQGKQARPTAQPLRSPLSTRATPPTCGHQHVQSLLTPNTFHCACPVRAIRQEAWLSMTRIFAAGPEHRK